MTSTCFPAPAPRRDSADLAELLDVQEPGAVRGLEHIFPQETRPFPRDELRARWLREIADAEVSVYVAEEHRLVGLAATRADEFLHFGTAVHTWGTGLATEVHDEVLNRMWAISWRGRSPCALGPANRSER